MVWRSGVEHAQVGFAQPPCSGAHPLMLDGISVRGILTVKSTIHGYWIEVFAGATFIIRTQFAQRDDATGLWHFTGGGGWWIPGAVESKFDDAVLQGRTLSTGSAIEHLDGSGVLHGSITCLSWPCRIAQHSARLVVWVDSGVLDGSIACLPWTVDQHETPVGIQV